MGERFVHTEEVTGSNPVSPTLDRGPGRHQPSGPSAFPSHPLGIAVRRPPVPRHPWPDRCHPRAARQWVRSGRHPGTACRTGRREGGLEAQAGGAAVWSAMSIVRSAASTTIGSWVRGDDGDAAVPVCGACEEPGAGRRRGFGRRRLSARRREGAVLGEGGGCGPGRRVGGRRRRAGRGGGGVGARGRPRRAGRGLRQARRPERGVARSTAVRRTRSWVTRRCGGLMAGQAGGLVGGFVLAVPPPGTAWSAAAPPPYHRPVRPGRGPAPLARR